MLHRARDQLWVFHSIRETDLHPDCMRRHLLRFCYDLDANKSDHNVKNYESDFERDVGEGLLRMGFRVMSQYEIARKRIDLVVEDGERRIAVECDGDAWHGPEQYEADMARQRMLERCGWQFIRIRGSAFYANRQRAFRELCDAIRGYGIEPHAFTGESVVQDWIAEVSGTQCMESLGASAVETGREDVRGQQEAETENLMEAVAELTAANGDAIHSFPPLHEASGPNAVEPVSVQSVALAAVV